MKKYLLSAFLFGCVLQTSIVAQTTFTNSTLVTIPAGAPTTTAGGATPYPSNIIVSGMSGTITNVTLTLTGLSHTFLNDIDMMLVAPNGDRFVFMSDAGGNGPGVTNATYTFSDAAATLFPAGTIPASGTYRPTDNVTPDLWNAIAADNTGEDATPAGAQTFASRFNGDNPNGTWSLYIMDDAGGDVGSLASWSLTITSCGVTGNPAVFPTGQWNVYCYNAGDAAGGSGAWTNNYSGFYSIPTLNFDTQSGAQSWANTLSPSSASGYSGCPVGVDNHSYIFKRTGVPTCGTYSIDANSHDDAAILFINGVEVWRHVNGCCDVHTNIWTGHLDASSTIEYRISEGGGGSNAGLTFNSIPMSGTVTGTNPTTCAGNGTITVSNPNGARCYISSSGFGGTPTGAVLSGSASITAEECVLTSTATGLIGSMVITPSIRPDNWEIVYSQFIGSGTGADGMSFSYGAGTPGGETGYATGVYVSFDTYDNPSGLTGSRVYVYYNNTLVTSNALNAVNLRTASYVPVRITINSLSQITVVWNGITVIPATSLPASYATDNKSTWTYAFSGRTGGLTDIHKIDNYDLYALNYAEYSTDGTTWQTSNIFSRPAGNYTVQMRPRCATSCVNTNIGSVTLVVTPTPEVNVQGNSQTIADGDATPGLADHTDFGSQSVCSGTIVRTFTIQNSPGTGTLTVATPTLSGTNAADFSVTAAPSSPVAISGSTTFQVTFNPSAAGLRTATISFTNNDCDENPYDFAIQGTGFDPEINVQGNSQTIVDGDVTPSLTDHTDFGSQSVCSGTIVRTFTIQNTGTNTLTVGTPTLSGTNAADFSVTASPSGTVASGGSTTFQVTFNPSATGARNATVTFTNNDCDESTYDFAIQGTGIDPEINVQGNSQTIVDGDVTPGLTDHTDFGSQSVCSGTIVRTFTIQNTGTNTLTVGTPTLSGTNAADFSVTASPSGTVASGGSTTFQVTFNPSATGLRTATISFSNDDCDESTYDFAIQGTGFDPEINVQGNSQTIIDGDVTPGLTDHTDFGSQSVCSGTIVRTFTIQNTGTNTLTVGTPTLSGANAADFSVTASPSGTVASGGSTTFQVTFNPSATGLRTATISFTNNDCDESSYDFTIQGTGIDPEVNVQGNSQTIIDGDVTPSLTDHTDFGSQSVCSGTIVRTFTIQNTGTSALTLGTPNLSGANAADFSVTASPSSPVAISGSTTFQVTFNPSATGLRTATLSFTNDDCDESTYDFAIQGTGFDPEINVQGNSNTIVDGDVTPGLTDHTDFGSVLACSGTLTRTFTIQNTGTSNLTLGVINITGAHASDYSVTAAPSSTITAGGSSTFLVTFDPGAAGLRTATISFTNNDCDEATYDFAIQGTGNADVILPSISCPGTQSINLNASCSATLPSYIGMATASDNCGSVTITQSPAIGSSVTGVGSTTVTLTATDGSGNSAQCSFTLNKLDVTAPASPVLADVSAECSATITPPTTSDNCAGTITGTTTDPVTYSSQGTFIIHWTFNDGNGNSSTANQNVIIDDVTNPVVSCPANQNLNVIPGSCTQTFNIPPPVTDNCSGATWGYSLSGVTSGSVSGLTDLMSSGPINFNVGTTSVILTATDVGGNSSTCSFNVTVTDNQLPVINCPSNITQPNSITQCGANVSFSSPAFSDNCPGAFMMQTGGLASGAFYPVGTTTNSYIVFDANGNSAACSFTVTILDTEAPGISCPSSVTQPADPGQCGKVVNYASPSFVDNCGTGTMVQTSGLPSGAFFPVGTTVNTFMVTDAANNSSVCSFTVTIFDDQDPVSNLPLNSITIDGCALSDAPAPATTVAGLESMGIDISDNCTADNVLAVSSADGTPSGGPCSNSFVRTYTISDVTGNDLVLNQTITVHDITPPTASNPATIILSGCNGSYPAPDTDVVTDETDNCGVVTVNFMSQTAPSMSGCTETITRIYNVSDACGNNINVTQTLQRIVDNSPPSISALPSASNINCPASPSFTTPSATDACGTPTLTFNDVTTTTCGSSYSVTRTWTATDACGNSSTASQTINVFDNTGPVISCGGTVLVNSSCVPATYTAIPPSVSDACGGPVTITSNHPSTSYPLGNTTVIWTATDACGNSSTCSRIITVTTPETDLLGNGYAINNTSAIISLTNGTDFGNVPVCSTAVTRTYVIKNTGSGSLSLSGTPKIQLTGLNAADFSVIQPLVSSLAPGASVSFQVIFDPSASGYRNARVIVPNNDCNESNYYYAIRGNGVVCSGPALVPDPSGQTQASGNNNNEEVGNEHSTLGVEDNNGLSALIYPNPSDGIFTLELSETPGENTQIKLLNNLGQVIYSSRLMVQTSYYDFSYLKAGTYYLQVNNPEIGFTKTIIITHRY